ncbi:fimbria/pilus outer membrane usher protein [Escherichia coli]|nr:fimbria/pilus outer membrane usher protein [Escherichia coli]
MYRTHRQHSLLSSGGVPSFIGGLVVFVSAAFNAQAETWFDPAFFKDDPSMVADLSRFEKGQKITPGVYRVDIVLNQTIVDTRNVNFVEITPEKGIAACLTTESLDAMGVNTDAFPAFKQLDKQACVPLAEIISQQLGEYGSFYLSGSQQTYWHTDQQDRLLQFGYNTQIKDLSLGVSWNYSKSRGQPDADQVFALNFSLPLNLLLPRSNDSYTRKKNYAWMTSNTSIDNEGHITQNLGLTETLLDDGNLSYSVQQGYNSEGKTANGSASMDYKGAFADARVGYNYSDNGSQQQLNYALSGSLVAHSQGITLGQSLGETNVLIAAPGAENTRVANSTGLKTDWRGYTVVPYATSYRENRIALDAASLKRNVDLENAVVNVVPTKGALVLAEFNAHAGARVLMKTSKQGIPLRFGAIATLDGIQTNSGIIDDDGSLYMSGLPAQGAITVRWGEAPDQICHISYQLTEQQINSAITRMDAICR